MLVLCPQVGAEHEHHGDDLVTDDEAMLRALELAAEELAQLLDSDELWADEMVVRIAERIGFAGELVAVAAP